ncbi:MAG TPA: O-antigen polymerase [Ginsengibacter sp.]|nr:O-antigen polymerase [Ginsengibacter sp.]
MCRQHHRGYSVRKRKRPHNFSAYPGWLIRVAPGIQVALLLIVLIGLPVYIVKSYQVFLASNIEKFFEGLRTELTYGSETLGPIVYLSSFSYFVLAVQQYIFYRNRTKANRLLFILSFVLALTLAIFTTGRGPILWVLSIVLGMNFLHGKRFTFKTIASVISIFIILFTLVGIALNKGGNIDASLSDNIETSGKTTASYLVASVNALDIRLQDNTVPTYDGDNSLRFFKLLGSKLGILPNAEANELIQQFVFVPYSTNVYTIYDTYYSDFGIGYTLFIILILGFFQTLIYYNAIHSKNIRFSIYYSLTLYPLLMSFFQDMYFSLTSTWIQIIIFTEALILLNRLILKDD